MTSNDWSWPGARWWRCDLHVHSPASRDYKEPTKAESADWVFAALAAGVQVAAVTDHSTPAGIDALQRAAEDSGLHLFPGVELIVSPGVHLLALFDPSQGRDAVAALLDRCGIPAEKFGDQDVCSSLSVVDAMKEIVEAGGLCIAAHADDARGVLREQRPGQPLIQVVRSTNLAAVEVKLGDPDLLRYVDGSVPEYRRPSGTLPLVASSDAHTLGEIGQRTTWIKMTRPTLGGLRLALQDGPLSVRDARDDAAPNRHAALAVERITIDKARYIGRSDPFDLPLNPWLNTLIGGRGTGKSSVVELLRRALRREDELPDALRGEWDDMVRVCQGRRDRGILTSDSRVSVIYRRDGARFRIQWDPAGAAPPIEVEQQDGSWVPSPGSVRDRFPVRIYSQKQVYELTREPEALLRIVDEAPEVGFQDWQQRWNVEEMRFLSLRAQAREVASALAEEDRVRGELEDVKRRLAVFETAGHADLLKCWQRRQRQTRAVDAWTTALDASVDRLGELADAAEPDTIDSTVFDPSDAADSALLQSMASVTDQVGKIRQEAQALAARAVTLRTSWPAMRESSPWSSAVRQADAAYQKLLTDLQAAGGGDPSEYGRLVQQRQLLEVKLAGFVRARQTYQALCTQAGESHSQLVQLRREISESRQAFLVQVLADNPLVRMDVIPMGALANVSTELRGLLGREDSAFGRDIGDQEEAGTLVGDLVATYSGDFEKADTAGRIALVDGHFLRLHALKERLWKTREGTQDARDRRFAQHMAGRPPEQMDRLTAWFPADTLLVSFRGAGRPQGFRSITQGSPGQRSAALLAFLLSHGAEPIILDQPEDDLDNQLVYELIVQQLRRIKNRRQVLVVTHNANIVVNGDAEWVVALDVRRGQVRQVSTGGLQEQTVRDAVCRVMEGGAEAFRERYRRIAKGDGDV